MDVTVSLLVSLLPAAFLVIDRFETLEVLLAAAAGGQNQMGNDHAVDVGAANVVS